MSNNRTFTPDNPMYPDVHVPVSFYEDRRSLVEATTDAIRRRAGHNAADWFAREASEQGTWDELKLFVRSTVRAS